MKRYLTLGGLLVVATPFATADTTLVDDNFDSYGSDAALYGVWEPRNGGGSAAPANPDDGILTTDDTLFPGITGQGVDHIGGSVLQHVDLTPAAPIIPTASQSIVYGGDIFVGLDGNSRMSIGLRNRTFDTTGAAGASNILELGTWNSAVDVVDPTTGLPFDPPAEATSYAFRMILMEGNGGDLIQNPNWQFFLLDPALDTGAEPDGVVDAGDIGAAWHRYEATITPDSVTVTLDLYRDGLDNGATLTAGSDVAGVDASVTYDVLSGTRGYDSLRVGSASGISSPNGVAFDNVFLKLVDVVGGINGDYNDSGLVEQGDLDQVLSNWGAGFASIPPSWVNQRPTEGIVDQAELDVVLTNWGSSAAPSFAGSNVPEPATLALLGLGGLAMLRRRA